MVGTVNKEFELFGGNKISFHWLKENIEEEIVLRDNMAAQNRVEDVERHGNKYFVLQQGEILGENYSGYVDRKHANSLIESMEWSDHCKEMMLEASTKIQESLVFQTNNLCVIAGDKDRQPPGVVRALSHEDDVKEVCGSKEEEMIFSCQIDYVLQVMQIMELYNHL